MKKTIFISSFHSLISRNIVTPLLPLLQNKSLRVVLLVPQKKKEYFDEIYKESDVVVEGIHFRKKPFEDFLYLLSISLIGVRNHVIDDLKSEGRYVRYYLAHIIFFFFGWCRLCHQLLRFITTNYLHTTIFDNLFKKYEPALIFSTDVFDRADRLLLHEAQMYGKATVGMVRSWDNPTTKGVLMVEPDYLIVQNQVLRDEMVTIHGISQNKIEIVGVPHYDSLKNLEHLSREDFCYEMGLDPRKKYILFAPAGKTLYAHDDELLEVLHRQLQKGSFIEPVQFLVRFPPGDTSSVQSIEQSDDFIIDFPGTNLTGRKKESEISVLDEQRLINSLLHSSIVLTVVSTIAIDGTVFDKPVIVWGFEPQQGLDDCIEKFGKCTHFEKFLQSNLVTVAQNEENLVQHINAFLTDPDFNKEERSMLIHLYAHTLDGKSTERLVALLERILNNVVKDSQ